MEILLLQHFIIFLFPLKSPCPIGINEETVSLFLLKWRLFHRFQQPPFQSSEKYLITLSTFVHNPYLALKFATSLSSLQNVLPTWKLVCFFKLHCLSNKGKYLYLQTLPCLLLHLYFTTHVTLRDRHHEEEHETAGGEQNIIIMPIAHVVGPGIRFRGPNTDISACILCLPRWSHSWCQDRARRLHKKPALP